MAQYPGQKIMLGAGEFVLPALSLGQLRNGAMEKIKEHDAMLETEGQNFEMALKRGELILTALRRNYTPNELSDEAFWDGIDLANLNDAWRAVLGLSGFSPGETPAAAADTQSRESTPPSQQPTDGLTQ